MALAALHRQSFRTFEVIIADDGSGPAIREVVKWARDRYGLSLKHLWHEDTGWRKNVMLNNAIRAADAEWMVFVDGDCLVSRHFLLDHWREREARRVLMGRRVETSERWMKHLTLERVESGDFERYGMAELVDGLRGRAVRIEDGIRIPSGTLRALLRRDITGMLGCNFSVAKADLEAINGFDELYNGPGCGEDSDVQHRLSQSGVLGKSMRNLAIQYHIWHRRMPVSEASRRRFEEVKNSGQARCAVGLVHLEA
jgi:glycosyltransferase involved in cell wall biosynthesis